MIARLWPSRSRPKAAGHPPFGFAVVGLGHGAEKFLNALRDSPDVRVAALVSDDQPHARRLQKRYAIPRLYSYAHFDQLRDDPAVHAVYLALPNALHLPFALRSAHAGKHVLCEKPMSLTPADCQAMIDACRARDRRLMIAYRCAFDPVYLRARELLAANLLGKITSIHSGFGFRAKPGWRLDPALAGGGSLFDVGVYSINVLHDLFPGASSILSADVTRAPGTGLEMEIAWTASLEALPGATVACHSSYLRKIPDFLRIEATHGTLSLQPAFAYKNTRLTARYTHPRTGQVTRVSFRSPSRAPSPFRLEAEHLALAVRTGQPHRSPGEDGLRDLETIRKIYAAARSAGEIS